jgi:hypothetical protein
MNTQTVTTEKVQFLLEWNEAQFKDIHRAIVSHFSGRVLKTQHGLHTMTHSFKAIDNLLGLAYTSSSSFALYGICNVELASLMIAQGYASQSFYNEHSSENLAQFSVSFAKTVLEQANK